MREICAQSGAREVYWFWLGIHAEPPHLALGVAPYVPEVLHRIGNGIFPIWRRARPDNYIFDLLPLDGCERSETIRERGRQLYRAPD